MYPCKNSLKAISKMWICYNSEINTVCRVWAIAYGKCFHHGMGMWLGFAFGVNSYASEWEVIPTIVEPYTLPFFDSALELSCHLWYVI